MTKQPKKTSTSPNKSSPAGASKLSPTVAPTVSIALTGSGGTGVVTAGGILLAVVAKAGLYGLFTRSAGPQIRGGEAAAMLRIGGQPVAAPSNDFDVLIALDWLNFERFSGELVLGPGSLVIADPDQGDVPSVVTASGARIVDLPMKQMAKAIRHGKAQGRPNMIALGAVQALLGLPHATVEGAIKDSIGKRGPDALAASLAGTAAGAKAALAFDFHGPVTAGGENAGVERWLISGNEAAGLGALRGGVRFVAAYPITPATEILEWMAPNLAKLGGALVQAEDELASINMIIGASYGGIPALTATSGPGLALMAEAIGLAVAAEVPVVVIDVMRGGPSTGIPTKSEQSDLNIAVFGLHGDAPHVVVAPQSVSDCVFTTQWAVHLAEAMQVPAIMLSDQLLGQSYAVIDRPADLAFLTARVTADAGAPEFRRYAVAGNGVSAMSVPGSPGGQYTADGLEHDERGLPSSRVSDHVAQLEKRARKVADFDYGDHWAEVDGDGPLAVIAWGSSAAAVREAIAGLGAKGRGIRLVAPRLLAPARPQRMAEALAGVERALVVELSHSAQFYHYLAGYFSLPCPAESFHRPGPVAFSGAELGQEIERWRGS